VRALLRRRAGGATPRVRTFADVVVDTAMHEVRRGDRVIELSAREFELLLQLMSRPNEVLTRERLLASVWGYASESNVLDVYIGYLRAKLEAGGEPRIVHTVRGVGFALRAPR
jgi:two-component system response regulator MprA